MKIGEFLIKKNIIDRTQLDYFLKEQKRTGIKLGELIVNNGIISEGKLIEYLSELKNIKFVDMRDFKASNEAIESIDKVTCEKYSIYPLRIRQENDNKVLYIAISDIENMKILDKIIIPNISRCEAILTSKDSIIAAIKRDYENSNLNIPGLNYEIINNINDGYEEENLINKINNLELQIEELRKKIDKINDNFNKKFIEKENTDKRIIAITKLLIGKKIFSKEDFFEIFKKFKN